MPAILFDHNKNVIIFHPLILHGDVEWGQVIFEQEGRNITGILDVYAAKGIVSEKFFMEPSEGV